MLSTLYVPPTLFIFYKPAAFLRFQVELWDGAGLMVLKGGPSPGTPFSGPVLVCCTDVFSLWICSEFSQIPGHADVDPPVLWPHSLLQSQSLHPRPRGTAASGRWSDGQAAPAELSFFSGSLWTQKSSKCKTVGRWTVWFGTASHCSDRSSVILFSWCGPAGGAASLHTTWTKSERDFYLIVKEIELICRSSGTSILRKRCFKIIKKIFGNHFKRFLIFFMYFSHCYF